MCTPCPGHTSGQWGQDHDVERQEKDNAHRDLCGAPAWAGHGRHVEPCLKAGSAQQPYQERLFILTLQSVYFTFSASVDHASQHTYATTLVLALLRTCLPTTELLRPSSVAPDPAESRGAPPPPQDPSPLRGTLPLPSPLHQFRDR